MDALAAFHFLRPWWLLLAPLVLAAWYWWRHYADPLHGWREQIAAPLLEALVPGGNTRRAPGGRALLAAWLLAVTALAGPSWRLAPAPFADDAAPLMIVLKAAESMQRPEPPPSPRERARLEIADLAEARKGQPLGLVAYAGSAHLVLPPTRDTTVVARMAAEVDAGVMPVPGDRLDLALREAARVLAQGAAGGSIVVLADSVETDAAALRAVRSELSVPVQFLAICAPQSAGCATLDAAVRTLGARLEPMDAAGDDTAAIVRRAAGATVAREDPRSARWQDAGYWLVAPLALLLLASFRRSETRGAPQ